MKAGNTRASCDFAVRQSRAAESFVGAKKLHNRAAVSIHTDMHRVTNFLHWYP